LGFLQAQPVRAESSDPHNIALHLYGAYTPGSPGYGNEMWAYGAAIQWGLSEHLAVSIDASQFSQDRYSITPVVGGLTYRPATPAKVRPTFEGGFGFYRLELPGVSAPLGLSSAGYPRDQFQYPASRHVLFGRNVAGGFVGAGAEAMLSSRLGLGSGVRIHGWADRPWSMMLALRTGLSYRF
jgi:hypothetical protein